MKHHRGKHKKEEVRRLKVTKIEPRRKGKIHDAGYRMHESRLEIPNPKHLIPKWFGQLTVLNQVEGQGSNIK